MAKNTKNILITYKGFEKKEKEDCFHFTALVKNFPKKNNKIVRTIYMVFDANKKTLKYNSNFTKIAPRERIFAFGKKRTC